MFSRKAEIEKLLEKYPDPRKEDGILQFRRKQEAKDVLPRYGIVVDNKDPNQLGRVRVACDTIAPGAITPWIPVLQMGASKKSGWWLIPDIGVQVLMIFVGSTRSRPVVIGCIFDLKHLPPKHTTEKVRDSKLFQTKNHRMEFIEEEGKEKIIISAGKGKMWLALSKENGIELINTRGSIKIKCRKFKVHSGDDLDLTAKKKVKLLSHGDMKFKAKNIKLNSGGDTNYKAKNIKLNASMGITSEGRQLAREGDKVMGIDVHRSIPGGMIPQPYIGKLAEKLSNNVKINGHNAATRESISKHDCPIHLPVPVTQIVRDIDFREGEVTGATARTVKINDKEAALIGSTVTTCNDIEMRDHSVVLAFGASIPMPMIINPKNMPEWKEERDKQEKKEPDFIMVRWPKGSCKEREKVELIAQVKDINDGNAVTFQIWREGQDPAAHIALRQLPARIEGGMAKVEFEWNHPNDQELPDEDPEFFATAHCPWCKPKESGMLTVELNRPEVTGTEWLDEEGNGTSKGLVGEPLKLEASCNGDFEEGAGVTFRIFNKGDDPNVDRPVFETSGINEGGKAVAEWTYRYRHDPENPLKEKPKFFFTANALRCKEAESGNVEIGMKISNRVCYDDRECIGELDYTLIGIDGAEKEGTTDKNGMIESDELLPANYKIQFNWVDHEPLAEEHEFIETSTLEEGEYNVMEIEKSDGLVELEPGQDYVLWIKKAGSKVSK